MVFRRLAKDSAVYGGADLVTKILAFFAFPIIAAALTPKSFGALELILTLTALLGLIMNCGLNNAVQRFYWDEDTSAVQQPSVVTSGLAAQVLFGMIAVLVGLLIVPLVLPWMQAEEWPLTWISLVAALIVMALSQWSQYVMDVIRLHFAPWRFFTLAIVTRIVTMAFGLIAVVLLGLGIDGLLVAQAIVLVIALPLALWLIRKDFQPKKFNADWFRELTRYGYPFIFAGLAYWLFGSMDRWMLASMTSVEEVGVYSVAFRFASVVLFFSAAFGRAWSPVAIKIRTDHPEHYRAIYGNVMLVLLFGMLAVGGGVALFSGEAIALTMPSDYLPSALPLAILCLGVTLQSIQQVAAIGISLENKTLIFARLAWLTALVNLVSNYFLIPPLGAAGAAWATLISYAVLSGSYLLYTQLLHPLEIRWHSLIALLTLGVLIALVSVSFQARESIYKFLFLLVCLCIGLKVLPIHSFRDVGK